MTAGETTPARTEAEAAAWFARLNTLSVPTQALEDFHAWRRDPANDAAYERVEQIWAASERLTHDPDTRRAVTEALGRGRLPRWTSLFSRPRARMGVGLAVVAASAALVVAAVVARGDAYVTGVGEQRLVSLEDGTRLRLDTDSAVQVRFTGARRDVTLTRGQAFFDVAHDASRPFVVHADDVSVRALGTRFDVRRRGEQVRVTLIEGVVEVADHDLKRAWRLAPGQALGTGDQVAAAPEAVDVATVTSWTTGRLIFRDTPLADAVAEVNRYSSQKIVVETPDLNAVPLNGVFEAGDTQAFVSAVSGLFELQVQWSKDEIRLSPKA